MSALAPTAPTAPATIEDQSAGAPWVVAGVAPQLARRLGVSPTTVRVVFVLGSFGHRFWVALAVYAALALVLPRGGRRLPGWANLVAAGRVGAFALVCSVMGNLSLTSDGMMGQGPLVWLPVSGAVITAWALLLINGRGTTESQARATVLGALPAVCLGAVVFAGVAIAPGVRWELVLDIGLIPVGGVLAVGGLPISSSRAGGLAAAVPAVALSCFALVLATSGARLEGGIGSLEAAPRTLPSAAPVYRRAIGDLTVDLRGLRAGSPQTLVVHASVAIGNITVRLPGRTAATVDARIGAGGLYLPGPTVSGFALRRVSEVLPYRGITSADLAPLRFRIVAAVGHGCIWIVTPGVGYGGSCQ